MLFIKLKTHHAEYDNSDYHLSQWIYSKFSGFFITQNKKVLFSLELEMQRA